MFSPLVILAAFTLLLAACGMLAYLLGWDSRDGFHDQVHLPTRR